MSTRSPCAATGPLAAAGLSLFALLAVLAPAWAEWDPSSHKLVALWRARRWHGRAVWVALVAACSRPFSPCWHDGRRPAADAAAVR